MSDNCNHDCSNCASKCSEATDFRVKQNEHSNVKKVIGIVSGKGGVGKSLVTSLLAVSSAKNGFSTAVLDADITGPSIPKAFGVNEKATCIDDKFLKPVLSNYGIKMMSINLLLENESDPVVWRGPVIAGVVKQFWADVVWGDVDYMFVDMPPGTGDVPLTVFQSLPLDGIVIVTSPQELVSMIVEKAAKMANMMNVPILGIVENMSYFECPDCKSRHYVFGKSNIEQIASKFGIEKVVQLPIDNTFASLCDQGQIEDAPKQFVDKIFKILN